MSPKKLSTTYGCELHDPLDRKIGRVEELFADGNGESKYLRVRVGSFGLGKSVLIPVVAVAVDVERRVVALQYGRPSLLT